MSSKSKIEIVAHATVQKSGLKSLSFRTLGAEVGVKSSSVHYHFPEKSDLGEALIKRYHAELRHFLQDTRESSPSVYASVCAFSQTFVEHYNEGKICFAGMMAAETEFLTGTNREHLNNLLNDVEAWLLEEFKRAGDELVIDLPASTLSTVLFASLEGALLIDRTQGSNNHLRAVQGLIDSWFGKIN